MNLIASISILISSIVVFFIAREINKMLNKRQDLIREQEEVDKHFHEMLLQAYDNILSLHKLVMERSEEIIKSDIPHSTDQELTEIK